jgi:hypothetical protein
MIWMLLIGYAIGVFVGVILMALCAIQRKDEDFYVN